MRPTLPHLPRHVVRFVVLGVAIALPAEAQTVPDDYFKYVPLNYPRIVRQTEASARFHLYGDQADPSYRDVSPADGIDDARGEWLRALALRFAPIMVRNTPQFPMDFRTFFHQESFPIFLDRWDVRRFQPSLADRQQVDLARLAGKLYLRILRPNWSALLPPADAVPPPLRDALDNLDNLDNQIRKLHEEAALAAA